MRIFILGTDHRIARLPDPYLPVDSRLAGQKRAYAASIMPIDMQEDERVRAGIYDEQENRNGDVRLPSDDIREDYWIKQISEEAKETDSVLVICGWKHLQQLAAKFRRAGRDVETDSIENRRDIGGKP